MQAFLSTAEEFMTQGNGDFLFSFVITACGAKQSKWFLIETVESILAQTVGFGENIQIVLVYDNQISNNELVATCEGYRKRYPNNIVLIGLPNGSLNAAHNAGLKAATGRWINFLEPGDKWDMNACKAALDFFGQHPEIHVTCFPITLFGPNKGAHWLNYKFTKTRAVNIFKDPDSAVLDLCSCFFAREAVQSRSFDEDLPISGESAWIAKLLIDEQDFGLIAKPYCCCRFTQSSAAEMISVPPLSYPESLYPDLDILRHAKERYGEAPEWAQYTVMLNLCRRLRETDRDILSFAQKEKYQELMRDCLKQIDDRIICTVRNPWPGERLIALALKHGMTYRQIRKWVKPDGEEKSLRFCRPGAESVAFAKPWELWLESMDIVEGRLLLRGSCPVLAAPSERMRLVLKVEFPDGGVREYPCNLFRRPVLQRRRLVFKEDFWPRESFELALPLSGKAEVRAFVEIDGLRFDMKWLHKQKSPFVQNDERSYWERASYTVSPLPDKTGLRVEPWYDKDRFLFSFVIPAYNVKQYLAETVESIIAQTIGFEENIQIVLVNDGSTDGTGAVCKRYRKLWPENIVYIDKPNGGVSSARNAGLKAATGRYINFPDADDKWDPEVCEAALDFFEKHPDVHIVCFPAKIFERSE
ncbi:MAG: glycosyltransferase family 2 protein, partial [Deltaproteobacteria bacterium]|nr:glycosyltransferase family 2 protein [Deltaproteobacteria bacterium]